MKKRKKNYCDCCEKKRGIQREREKQQKFPIKIRFTHLRKFYKITAMNQNKTTFFHRKLRNLKNSKNSKNACNFQFSPYKQDEKIP